MVKLRIHHGSKHRIQTMQGNFSLPIALMNEGMANMIFQSSLPVLPSRSQTHPMWTAKQSSHKSKHPEPFDPQELYRRLEKHKEEQVRAHERRKAGAEKHKAPKEYRHVPQYAAADFVNTASVNWLESQTAHPLARHISRSKRIADPQPPKDGHVSRFVEQQDLASQKVQAIADRNQFQRTQVLQIAAEADDSRDLFRRPQRDFESFFASKSFKEKAVDDISSPAPAELDLMNEELDRLAVHKRQLIYQPDDRHDWAQRDECAGHEQRSLRDRILPILRKTRLLGDNKEQRVDLSARQKRFSLRKSGFLSFSV
ncbi:hypothetical protein MMC13_005216 [Lambiella insularis]|nr:hypothetical protein [Lambiella insularis]